MSGLLTDHVAKARKALQDGYVIVLPTENSYALVADAFVADAVRALHVLRGDALGVLAQVMIAESKNIDGIAREISDNARALMSAFWPGKLSLNLKPQVGLNWDLGDARELDCISVQIPESEFLRALILANGPIAIASAAKVGEARITDPAKLNFTEQEVGVIFSMGELSHGPASTVVDCTGAKLRIMREAAISHDEITSITPDISLG